jgi:hypothetical protein
MFLDLTDFLCSDFFPILDFHFMQKDPFTAAWDSFSKTTFTYCLHQLCMKCIVVGSPCTRAE